MEVLIEVSNLSAFIVVKGCEFKIENEIRNFKSILYYCFGARFNNHKCSIINKGKIRYLSVVLNNSDNIKVAR